eukprot:jgi/Mesvir1/12377/Mv25024-RA.1
MSTPVESFFAMRDVESHALGGALGGVHAVTPDMLMISSPSLTLSRDNSHHVENGADASRANTSWLEGAHFDFRTDSERDASTFYHVGRPTHSRAGVNGPGAGRLSMGDMLSLAECSGMDVFSPVRPVTFVHRPPSPTSHNPGNWAGHARSPLAELSANRPSPPARHGEPRAKGLAGNLEEQAGVPNITKARSPVDPSGRVFNQSHIGASSSRHADMIDISPLHAAPCEPGASIDSPRSSIRKPTEPGHTYRWQQLQGAANPGHTSLPSGKVGDTGCSAEQGDEHQQEGQTVFELGDIFGSESSFTSSHEGGDENGAHHGYGAVRADASAPHPSPTHAGTMDEPRALMPSSEDDGEARPGPPPMASPLPLFVEPMLLSPGGFLTSPLPHTPAGASVSAKAVLPRMPSPGQDALASGTSGTPGSQPCRDPAGPTPALPPPIASPLLNSLLGLTGEGTGNEEASGMSHSRSRSANSGSSCNLLGGAGACGGSQCSPDLLDGSLSSSTEALLAACGADPRDTRVEDSAVMRAMEARHRRKLSDDGPYMQLEDSTAANMDGRVPGRGYVGNVSVTVWEEEPSIVADGVPGGSMTMLFMQTEQAPVGEDTQQPSASRGEEDSRRHPRAQWRRQHQRQGSADGFEVVGRGPVASGGKEALGRGVRGGGDGSGARDAAFASIMDADLSVELHLDINVGADGGNQGDILASMLHGVGVGGDVPHGDVSEVDVDEASLSFAAACVASSVLGESQARVPMPRRAADASAPWVSQTVAAVAAPTAPIVALTGDDELARVAEEAAEVSLLDGDVRTALACGTHVCVAADASNEREVASSALGVPTVTVPGPLLVAGTGTFATRGREHGHMGAVPVHVYRVLGSSSSDGGACDGEGKDDSAHGGDAGVGSDGDGGVPVASRKSLAVASGNDTPGSCDATAKSGEEEGVMHAAEVADGSTHVATGHRSSPSNVGDAPTRRHGEPSGAPRQVQQPQGRLEPQQQHQPPVLLLSDARAGKQQPHDPPRLQVCRPPDRAASTSPSDGHDGTLRGGSRSMGGSCGTRDGSKLSLPLSSLRADYEAVVRERDTAVADASTCRGMLADLGRLVARMMAAEVGGASIPPPCSGVGILAPSTLCSMDDGTWPCDGGAPAGPADGDGVDDSAGSLVTVAACVIHQTMVLLDTLAVRSARSHSPGHADQQQQPPQQQQQQDCPSLGEPVRGMADHHPGALERAGEEVLCEEMPASKISVQMPASKTSVLPAAHRPSARGARVPDDGASPLSAATSTRNDREERVVREAPVTVPLVASMASGAVGADGLGQLLEWAQTEIIETRPSLPPTSPPRTQHPRLPKEPRSCPPAKSRKATSPTTSRKATSSPQLVTGSSPTPWRASGNRPTGSALGVVPGGSAPGTPAGRTSQALLPRNSRSRGSPGARRSLGYASMSTQATSLSPRCGAGDIHQKSPRGSTRMMAGRKHRQAGSPSPASPPAGAHDEHHTAGAGADPTTRAVSGAQASPGACASNAARDMPGHAARDVRRQRELEQLQATNYALAKRLCAGLERLMATARDNQRLREGMGRQGASIAQMGQLLASLQEMWAANAGLRQQLRDTVAGLELQLMLASQAQGQERMVGRGDVLLLQEPAAKGQEDRPAQGYEDGLGQEVAQGGPWGQVSPSGLEGGEPNECMGGGGLQDGWQGAGVHDKGRRVGWGHGSSSSVHAEPTGHHPRRGVEAPRRRRDFGDADVSLVDEPGHEEARLGEDEDAAALDGGLGKGAWCDWVDEEVDKGRQGGEKWGAHRAVTGRAGRRRRHASGPPSGVRVVVRAGAPQLGRKHKQPRCKAQQGPGAGDQACQGQHDVGQHKLDHLDEEGGHVPLRAFEASAIGPRHPGVVLDGMQAAVLDCMNPTVSDGMHPTACDPDDEPAGGQEEWRRHLAGWAGWAGRGEGHGEDAASVPLQSERTVGAVPAESGDGVLASPSRAPTQPAGHHAGCQVDSLDQRGGSLRGGKRGACVHGSKVGAPASVLGQCSGTHACGMGACGGENERAAGMGWGLGADGGACASEIAEDALARGHTGTSVACVGDAGLYVGLDGTTGVPLLRWRGEPLLASRQLLSLLVERSNLTVEVLAHVSACLRVLPARLARTLANASDRSTSGGSSHNTSSTSSFAAGHENASIINDSSINLSDIAGARNSLAAQPPTATPACPATPVADMPHTGNCVGGTWPHGNNMAAASPHGNMPAAGVPADSMTPVSRASAAVASLIHARSFLETERAVARAVSEAQGRVQGALRSLRRGASRQVALAARACRELDAAAAAAEWNERQVAAFELHGRVVRAEADALAMAVERLAREKEGLAARVAGARITWGEREGQLRDRWREAARGELQAECRAQALAAALQEYEGVSSPWALMATPERQPGVGGEGKGMASGVECN